MRLGGRIKDAARTPSEFCWFGRLRKVMMNLDLIPIARWAIATALMAFGASFVGCDDLPDTAAETETARFEPRAEGEQPRYGTEIVTSRELGTLKSRVGQEEYAGVKCGVCHSLPDNTPPAQRPEELEDFHTGMQFAHGDLTCNSCHHPEDRDLLRLADGRSLEFSETMDLCGQCHGPQMRDYNRAAHGGMKGHWNLDDGPRTRNSCVNCHDPHEPAFPSMIPAPPPQDPLLEPDLMKTSDEDSKHEEGH